MHSKDHAEQWDNGTNKVIGMVWEFLSSHHIGKLFVFSQFGPLKTLRTVGRGSFQIGNCSYRMSEARMTVHKRSNLCEVKEIHARMIGNANELQLFEKNTLMDMYVKSGSIVDAQCVFDTMQKRNVVSWNIMILAYGKVEKGALALELYAEMHEAGVQPIDRTFVAALKACSTMSEGEGGKQVDGKFLKLWCLEKGRTIHAQALKSGFESNVFVGNILVVMYAKCGSMEDARHVFDRMLHCNIVSWNAMILAHAQNDEGVPALSLYERMYQEGVIPNQRTFVAALKACSSLAILEEGKQIDRKCVLVGCLEKGRAIHSQVVKSGFEADVFIGTILVDMYAKCNNMEDAQHVFGELPHHDAVAWTAMISGYVQREEGVLALEMYERMQQEGVVPDDRPFVGALKACSSLATLEQEKQVTQKFVKIGCLEKGRAIHTQVVKIGFQSSVFVGNTLVDMYMKCGSMEDALHVFDQMHRNVVSWNTMILGHVQNEDGALALELYARMYQEGVMPDDRTFVAALKACSSLSVQEEGFQVHGKFVKMSCLEKGRAIHSQVVKSGFDSDVFVGTTLVDMYAKCRSMEDAWQVFRTLPQQDVVSWTALISGYAQKEEGALALELYTQMHQEGVIPYHRTFVSALKACTSLAVLEEGIQVDGKLVKVGCLEKGRTIHSQAVKSGCASDVFVGTILVDMYAKCGTMEDARHVFDELLHHDVVCWTAMISEHAHNEEGALALELYARMQQEGVQLSERTFAAALKACSSLAAQEEGKQVGGGFGKAGCLKKGRAIHSEAVKHGFESNVIIGNTLVEMYAKCGSMEDARHVFDEMPHCNVLSWTAVILAHAQKEEGVLALELYAQMYQEGVQPSDWIFVAVLKACSSLAALEDGKQVDGRPLKIGSLEKGRAIHSHVVEKGFESYVFVGNTLVDMYAKCLSVEDARHVFDDMPHRDVVSWTSMIWGYAEQGQCKEALRLYTKMQEQGLSADSITFASILKACANVSALETGKEFHSQICRDRLDKTLVVATTLIDMYAKFGSMVDAQHLFDTLSVRDFVTWNVLIAGYTHQGESELVFSLFQRMSQEGMEPTGITFLNVLSTCSHAGLVDKGQQYFEAMNKQYGIIPSIEHYTCMIDLIGRAGQLEVAMAMMEKMPFQPDLVSWLAVLGACRNWKDVEVGRHAFEHAVRLDEKNSAAYLLMSSIYAHAHMWVDYDKIQALRKFFSMEEERTELD